MVAGYLAITLNLPAEGTRQSSAPPEPSERPVPREPLSKPALVMPPPPPAAPRLVELSVHDAPPGARLLLDGKPIGDAPGPISIAFSEKPAELSVEAAGYEPRSVSITPDKRLTLSVQLKKRAPRAKAKGNSIPSDLESPF